MCSRGEQDTPTKKHPQKGVFSLVYPLGLEPRLDGVGGHNVIQLHYEYILYKLFDLDIAKPVRYPPQGAKLGAKKFFSLLKSQ